MRWMPVLLPPLLAAAVPAFACSIAPPRPGERLPSQAQVLRSELARFDTVAQVEVLRSGSAGDRVPIRVLQPLKGGVRAGAVLTLGRGYGFNPPPCAAMIIPPREYFRQGERLVIAFRAGQPEFNRVKQVDLDLLVRNRWIAPVRAMP